MKKEMAASLLGMFLIAFSACAVGGRHTSDAELERDFIRHENQFKTLLTEVMADERLAMIGIGELRYADYNYLGKNDTADINKIEHVGMTKDRWMRYQKQLTISDWRWLYEPKAWLSSKLIANRS